MEGLGLFPHNCNQCGFWTATELQRRSKGWTLSCTHCGTVQQVHGDTRKFRLFVASVERFVANAPLHYPELARLTVRGAYTAYQPLHEKKGRTHSAPATTSRSK